MESNKSKITFKDVITGFKNDEEKRTRFIAFFILFIGCVSILVGISNYKKGLTSIEDKEEKEREQAVENVYALYNKLKAEGKIKTENSNLNNNSNTESDYSRDKDTDGDGISDYDEKYIFNTSVYLTDSDGDGISDYDEIIAGTNPNDINSFSKITSNISSNISAVNKDVDMKEVRAKLYEIIPENLKSAVNGMTDAEILQMLSQLYNNQEGEGQNNSNNDIDYKKELKSKLPNFTDANLKTIENMNESEIKQLLIDSNIADEKLLSNFKEGEIKSTVLNK